MRASTEKLALGLVVALGASACDDGSAAAAADQKVVENATAQWEALRACLIGPPLSEGEKAKDRMLRSELTVVARGLKTEWPASCAPLGTELGKTLVTLKSDASVSQYAQLGKLAKELGDTSPTMMLATETPIVGRLFEAAAQAGMLKTQAAPAASGSAPAPSASAPSSEPADAGAPADGQLPPASSPLPIDQLAALGQGLGIGEPALAAQHPGVVGQVLEIGDADVLVAGDRAAQ